MKRALPGSAGASVNVEGQPMYSRLDEILGGGGKIAADPVQSGKDRQKIRSIVIESIEHNGLFSTVEHITAVRDRIGYIDEQSEQVIFKTIEEQF